MLKLLITALAALASTVCLAASVDINQATEAELDSIKGVGPGMSGKILEERGKGSFKDWRDLIHRVKGIGAHTAAKMSDQGVTLDGKAFKPAAAASQTPAN